MSTPHDRAGDELPLEPDPNPGRRRPHQPANPADLVAFPPRDETCARIRGLLRDFVDSDLLPPDYAAVETHVHECRSCALALSRAESELMQIQSALGAVDRAVLRAPSGLLDSVMNGVREAATTQPTVGFTQRVMARVREESLTDELRSPSVRRIPLLMVAAACLLLTTLVVLVSLDPNQPVAIEVVTADRAEWVRDGEAAPIVETDQWTVAGARADDEFATGEAGALELACTSRGKVLAIVAAENTTLRVDASAPESGPVVGLRRGEVTIASVDDATVALRDGSAVHIGTGRMAVAVENVRYLDTRPVLRVTVLVSEGIAHVARGSVRTRVAAGQEATYTTFSGVAVGPAPDASLFADSKRRADAMAAQASAIPDERELFFGQVIDPRTSTPVAGVSVAVTTFLGTQSRTTDARGRFQIEQLEALDGQFVVVRAAPSPTTAAELAPSPAIPILVESRAQRAEPHRIFLGRSRILRGRLHDASNRPIPGLWLQPCRVDEQFGTVETLGRRQRLDARGEFSFSGLPAEARPLQTLVLVAGVQASESSTSLLPQIVWARAAVGVEDGSLDLTLPAPVVTRTGGFTPDAVVHLLQGVRGLPLSGAVQARELRADAEGFLSLDLTVPLYLTAVDREPQRILVADGTAEFLEEPLPESIAVLRAGSIPAGRVRWFRRDARHTVARVPADGIRYSVEERVTRQVCPETQMFLRTPGEGIRFLGVFDGRASLACEDDTTGRLFARTPQGWVGALDLKGTPSRPMQTLAVDRPGRIRWQGPSNGVVALERLGADGRWTPIARMAAEAEWTLTPGRYRYQGREFALEPDLIFNLK